MKISIQIFLWCLLLLSCTSNTEKESRVETLPFYSEASFTPHWLALNSMELQNFHQIPSFSLTNQLGQEFNLDSLGGEIYVANFFFTTCPGICPKLTSNMNLIQEEFINDSEILLLSHTVNPQTDTVAALANYAESKGVIAHKWHLLTGERSEIYSLGRNAYFIEEDLGIAKSDEDFLHTENIVLIDKNKHIRGIYNGLNATAIQQLIADIYLLKQE